MSNNEFLTLLLLVVAGLLVLVLAACAVIGFIGLRWWRRRAKKPDAQGQKAVQRPAVAASPPAASPSHVTPAGSGTARSEVVPAAQVPHGDVRADDPRIVALGLEPPTSAEAVFRNLEKVKPILRQEAAESDRISRTSPLAGGALRATGVFEWGFPRHRGGIDASYADRLEAVTQVARIDAGMAWIVTWLSAHGEVAGTLDDESFAELYPSIDLPTTFSATPLARAVEIDGDKYRIEKATWRLGSGGFHSDRWIAGVKVWDTAGKPVTDELTGEQKTLGVWLPADKVRQADDWHPLGVRSSGSASYFLTEPVEIPRRWSFNMGADLRPYFFPFMGVLVGMAQHMIDFALETLRVKRPPGGSAGAYDRTTLTEAMALLDMLVFGLRGYAQYIDRVRKERVSGSITREESAWIHSVGMPVRQTLLRIRDLTADIYGTAYVGSGSEFGRILRDLQVALAHGWFRLSDTPTDHGWRVARMLDDLAVIPIWDAGWPVKITGDVRS